MKTKSNVRQRLFQKFATYNFYVVFIGIILYALSAIAYLVYPFIMYYLERKFVPLLTIFVPGVDEKTIDGYITLSCIHIIILLVASLGLAGVDLFYAILLVNIPVMSNLVKIECTDLNALLKEKPKLDYLWKQKFKNILLMHLEETK